MQLLLHILVMSENLVTTVFYNLKLRGTAVVKEGGLTVEGP